MVLGGMKEVSYDCLDGEGLFVGWMDVGQGTVRMCLLGGSKVF